MDENSTTYYAHTKLIKLESRLSAVISKLDKLYSVRLEMIGVLPESVVANASDEILLLQERAHELRENIRRELEEGTKFTSTREADKKWIKLP
jgi:hypothetical protein